MWRGGRSDSRHHYQPQANLATVKIRMRWRMAVATVVVLLVTFLSSSTPLSPHDHSSPGAARDPSTLGLTRTQSVEESPEAREAAAQLAAKAEVVAKGRAPKAAPSAFRNPKPKPKGARMMFRESTDLVEVCVCVCVCVCVNV